MASANDYRNLSISVAGHAALLVAGLLVFSSPPSQNFANEAPSVEVVSNGAMDEIARGAPNEAKVQEMSAPELSSKPPSPPLAEEARQETPVSPPPLPPHRPDLESNERVEEQPEPSQEAAREPMPTPPVRPADLVAENDKDHQKVEKDEADPVEPPKPAPKPKPKTEMKPQDIKAFLEAKARQNEAKKEKPRAAREPPKTPDAFDATAINKIIGSRANKEKGGAERIGHRVASLGDVNGNAPRMGPQVLEAFANWLANAYKGCWHYYGSNTDYKPDVEIQLSPDGSLTTAPRLVNASRNPAAATKGEAALRAIKECSPLHVPERFKPYNEAWTKPWTITFDPQD